MNRHFSTAVACSSFVRDKSTCLLYPSDNSSCLSRRIQKVDAWPTMKNTNARTPPDLPGSRVCVPRGATSPTSAIQAGDPARVLLLQLMKMYARISNPTLYSGSHIAYLPPGAYSMHDLERLRDTQHRAVRVGSSRTYIVQPAFPSPRANC